MDDQIMTLDEVSKFLRVNKATIYRLAQAGKIPALKVGKVWRFKRARLEAWLEHQEGGLQTQLDRKLSVGAYS